MPVDIDRFMINVIGMVNIRDIFSIVVAVLGRVEQKILNG